MSEISIGGCVARRTVAVCRPSRELPIAFTVATHGPVPAGRATRLAGCPAVLKRRRTPMASAPAPASRTGTRAFDASRDRVLDPDLREAADPAAVPRRR